LQRAGGPSRAMVACRNLRCANMHMAKSDRVPKMPLKNTPFVLKRAGTLKISSVLIRSLFFATIVRGTHGQLLTDVRKPTGPMTMTFYMYHAPESLEQELPNSVAGDLPGLMWKIHNDVSASPTDRHTAKSIVRYKVTMRATERLHDERHRQFGPFVTFRSGKCMERSCDNIWNQYGFNIGCQTVNTSDFAYYSPFVTRLGGGACPPNCNDGLWFSIPVTAPRCLLMARRKTATFACLEVSATMCICWECQELPAPTSLRRLERSLSMNLLGHA